MTGPVRSVHTGYAQRIVFGPQSVDDVPAVVKETGARRVMVVTTEGRAASDAGRRLVEQAQDEVRVVLIDGGEQMCCADTVN
jgi:alcohol dehydrogenase class IV